MFMAKVKLRSTVAVFYAKRTDMGLIDTSATHHFIY